MVYIADSRLNPIRGDSDWQAWLQALEGSRGDEELALLRRACGYAAECYDGRSSAEGEALLSHALGTADIAAGLRLDGASLAAAVLYAVPECVESSAVELEKRFGREISTLVEGIWRMGQIREFSRLPAGENAKQAEAHVENLRKMLLAMVEDVRVVLIKLAERTQALRFVAKADEETRYRVAREIQDLFAPLANRLGVWQIKWEMEDLAFRYLDPELYKKIAKLLDERRVDREQYIEEVKEKLRTELARVGIAAEVSGRPKHIFSIYKKMKRKDLDFTELYDVRAVRILVNTVADCYAALGIVHNLWQPIPKEFDDYISRPKGNAYQSLHTAVVGPEDKALEVQIRTHDMHRHAELGVAAHWRYKEGGKQDVRFEEKIAWLRQILEWKEEVEDAGEIMEQFKTGLFQDTVYVLTPQGKVIPLPKGATPLDFAYHLHTDLGHRCRGAKVDGAIVPLTTPLQTGQRVEILTAKQGGPSRDWLNPALGYVQTGRARSKISHWFKYQHYEENIAQGRDSLEKEAHRQGVALPTLERMAQKFGYDKSDDFLAAVGRGDISARQAVAAAQEEAPKPVEEWRLSLSKGALPTNKGSILVEDMGNLLTVMAKCCKPVPPDPIVGFVTRGRGVAIHRSDCPNVQRLTEEGRQRLLSAQWGKKTGLFDVDIEVEANDRQGLLRDITEALTREKVNVIATNTLSRGLQAAMSFTVQVAGVDQLERILTAVRDIPGVTRARRR
ncbi:MAG: GTP diphosphokinase [Sulfuricellaceae bacterium]